MYGSLLFVHGFEVIWIEFQLGSLIVAGLSLVVVGYLASPASHRWFNR